MINCLFVGIGGFVGSVLRYIVGMIPIKFFGIPLNTFIVNVAGAFVIGLVVALCAKNPMVDSRLFLMLKVGLCGGFTTFSTFSLETVDLIKGGSWFIAFVYIVLSVVLCIGAILAAQYIVK